MAAPQAEQSSLASAVDWVLENKLRTVLYTWGTGITTCLAYQWTRPNVPVSLRIIHSRVYAQALTLGALGAVAAVEMYAASSKDAKPKEKSWY